jgi:hypothetical protein
MTRILLALVTLLAVGGAGAEMPQFCITDNFGDSECKDWSVYIPENVYMIDDPSTSIVFPSCITTEFCGDPAEDSDVRCVRAVVCGEEVR